MALEIRIMTGARAGQVVHLDTPLVTVGRQAGMDVRFDAQKDLDVSGRHAEIRLADGAYTLQDLGSTNGTFVNGEQLQGARVLRSGDRVQFGAKGPDVEIRIHRGVRSNTEERIAIAVKKQTAGLRRMAMVGGVVLVAGLGGVYYMSQRAGQQRVDELNRLLRRNDSLSTVLQGGISGADPALVQELQRKTQELRDAMGRASTDAERDSIRRAIESNDARLRRMVQMDLSSIHRRNAPAVAVLVSEIRGVSFAGTGFSISADGLLMTNRHNVLSERGDTASRIIVKFVDTREWLPARVVKISGNPDEDLALIQLETEGPFPAVEGLSSGADATEGLSVVTIGFPLGYETPQEGEGNDFIAKSTLNPGTVSKRTSTVLQIDSYAAHGSSGSPVFNSMGHVVGVVFGGQRDAGGRIVFAVPPDRVAAFVPQDRRAILRD
jgi:S1-C subfamily serine protease